MEELQRRGKAKQSEKEEMGRLYGELVEQLRAAEEAKVSLQVLCKARGTGKGRTRKVKTKLLYIPGTTYYCMSVIAEERVLCRDWKVCG